VVDAVQTCYTAVSARYRTAPVRMSRWERCDRIHSPSDRELITSRRRRSGPIASECASRYPFVEPSELFWLSLYNPAPAAPRQTHFWSDYQNYVVAVSQLQTRTFLNAFTIGTELKRS